MVDLNDAIREAVASAVRGELAPIRAALESLALTLAKPPQAPSMMTPQEVAAQQRVRSQVVYDALASGDLPSIQRPARGGRMGYLVKPEDAAAWGRQLARSRKVVPSQPETSTRTLSADAA